MNDLQALIIYVTNHPDYTFEVYRMRYSGGVMTLLDVGPFRIRWDSLCTAAFRKHWNNADYPNMKKLFVKHLHARDMPIIGDIDVRIK